MSAKGWKVATAAVAAFFAPAVAFKVMLAFWDVGATTEPANVVMVVLSVVLGAGLSVAAAMIAYDLLPGGDDQ